MASVYSTDRVEVRLPIPPREMANLALPEKNDDAPLPARVTSALTTGSTHQWDATIIGTEGALDPDSKELFAIAHIIDPFGLEPANASAPLLRIGQPVTVEIDARLLEEVLIIPREDVRGLDTIYLIDPETRLLRSTQFSPVWSDSTRFAIRDDAIPDGTLLSTSRLVNAPDGAEVEIVPPASPEVLQTAN